jgi:hypothetical protein
MTSKLAIVVSIAALTATSAVRAADDLPEQRMACQAESQRHIPGRSGAGVELFRRTIERRAQYVSTCMATGPRDVEQTGSTSPPLPPKRGPGI